VTSITYPRHSAAAKVRALALALLAATLTLLCIAGTADAAFPGKNGRILFVSDRSGASQIYTMNPDGSDVRNLTSSGGDNYYPAVSPDGRRIAFVSTRDGNPEIYSMDTDGTHQLRLTSNPQQDYEPTFSPNGATIVFSSNRTGRFSLFSMNATNGTGVTRVIGPGTDWHSPSFSPDGKKLVATSDSGTGEELFQMNADGSSPVRLLTSGSSIRHPSFSPDGKKVVFDVGATDTDVKQFDLMSSTFYDLAFSAELEEAGSYSPDGTKVLYTCQVPGSPADICTQNSADRSGKRRLGDPKANEQMAAWMSPSAYDDGTRPALTVGTPQLQKRKGTATVDVGITRRGKLSISGTGAGTEQRDLNAGASSTIAIRALGKVRKKLVRKGKASVSLTVTYTADIGDPITKTVSVKLLKTRKRK
jgi:Tol biopolymer transport system component